MTNAQAEVLLSLHLDAGASCEDVLESISKIPMHTPKHREKRATLLRAYYRVVAERNSKQRSPRVAY